MFDIAAGVVLAVLFLALLPVLMAGALWLFALGLIVVLVVGAVWMVLAGAQTVEGLAIELVVAGVFLIWLHFEIKARREVAEERAAKTQHRPARTEN